MKNQSQWRIAAFGLAAALVCGSAASAQEAVKAIDSRMARKSPPHKKSARLTPDASATPWAPADVDATVPAVAPNASCSLPDVLAATSQRVKELVTNLQQFTATERLEHEKVDPSGNPHAREARTFNYLVAISETSSRMVFVEEYRNGQTSLHVFPAGLATLGLPALALIFHPYLVGDFQITCEGLGQWRGQPAWQLHFQQRPGRPSRIRSYRINNNTFSVRLKGRAWIAADTFQILRLETDLMEPVPAIRLQREHLAIEYCPVQFRKRGVELWLPESAEVYYDLRGHRYHRRHSFSDFQLFAVDVDQTIHEPPEP